MGKQEYPKISEPGVYDIPLEIYHEDPCVTPSISSSGLREIENKSPAHYWATSPYNPNRLDEEQKDHFNLGSAAHTLILGESGFRDKYAIRPGRWDSWRTNAAKEWREEMIAVGRMVLEDKQVEAIKGMAKSLEAHPEVSQGILRGDVEKSLIWKDSETGIWLRARPDVIPTDSNIVVDLKTTASADNRSIHRGMVDLGYYIQLALVDMGFKAVLNREVELFGLVYMETKPPYVVVVRPVDAQYIYWGACQVRRALRIFNECLKTGNWPGYPEDGIPISPPDWFQKRMERERHDGLLPDVG